MLGNSNQKSIWWKILSLSFDLGLLKGRTPIVSEGINFAKDYKKYSCNKNILMGEKKLNIKT
jgi:hypothetical protein